ncbi:MAG: DUF89 family protein [Solobacterium sp.]|nr:DUF89 family protein [Solobacterium sp.]
MKINELCIDCIWKGQNRISDNPEYLSKAKEILDTRKPEDTAPYLTYQCDQVYRKMFDSFVSFKQIKQDSNDFVLALEESIVKQIEAQKDPLASSIAYARNGNFIDYASKASVDENEFLEVLQNAKFSKEDEATYQEFEQACKKANSFLLIADNCGEIVLDKLFLRILKKRYPQLHLTVLVRGGDVLNDVTMEDALYIGLDEVATIVPSGKNIAGTIEEMLSPEAKELLYTSDVIFAKGQGNYESLSDQNRDIFYSFLCKCDFFMEFFQVPRYTGLFIHEKRAE